MDEHVFFMQTDLFWSRKGGMKLKFWCVTLIGWISAVNRVEKIKSWNPASDELGPTLLQIKLIWHFTATCTHFHSGSTCPDSNVPERAFSPAVNLMINSHCFMTRQFRLKGLRPDLDRKVNYSRNVWNINDFHKVHWWVQFRESKAIIPLHLIV